MKFDSRVEIGTLEERDGNFLALLMDDIDRLTAAGYDNEAVKEMLGVRNYVRRWVGAPRFGDVLDKLPAKIKLRDCRKIQADAVTAYAYISDDCLYLFSRCFSRYTPVWRVWNWREYTMLDIVAEAEKTYLWADSATSDLIKAIWTEYRLPDQNGVLKSVGRRSKNE